MKKILAALLLLSSATFAQNRNPGRDQPPAPIRQSFKRDHSTNPDNANWTKTSSNWHANFKDNNNHNVDSYYDRRGNRIATHREIDRQDVPRGLDTRINDRYHANGNYDVRRIERPNAQPLFQIGLRLGSGSRTVYMDAQGRERQYRSPR